MIIGKNREQVIKNIKHAANIGAFSAKVELDDPQISLQESLNLVNSFWEKQNKKTTKFNNYLATSIFSLLAHTITFSTKLEGLKNLNKVINAGAIITANHFNQLDALPIKKLADKKHKKLNIVIEDTNLKLPGFLGYMMRHVDTIPLVKTPNYIAKTFDKHLQQALNNRHWVLIYPEQEMWWNYRKPRIPHRGAYFLAAKHGVPIIPIFTELQSRGQIEKSNPNFSKVKYVTHILRPIFPRPNLNTNQASKMMMNKDYQQKVLIYEKIYKKKLNYKFTPKDIAGFQA